MTGLPPPGAGPDQVRAYLADVLVKKHDVSLEFAQTTADLWRFGRGSGLYSGAKQDFVRVFGAEIGPFLYASVGEDKYAEWRASTWGIITYWTFVIACVTPVFFFTKGSYSHWHPQAVKDIACAFLLCGLTLVTCAYQESPVRDDDAFPLAGFFGLVLTIGGVIIALAEPGKQ